MKRYTVRYERDEAGSWVATVNGLTGCHTQGRTVGEARQQAAEVIGGYLGRATASGHLCAPRLR